MTNGIYYSAFVAVLNELADKGASLADLTETLIEVAFDTDTDKAIEVCNDSLEPYQ